jgi:hypothetical protein
MFLWQVCNDKVQSAEQLARKNWQGPIECKLCGRLESAEHIFVLCALAKFCWSVFKDVLCDAPGFQLTLTAGQSSQQWSNHGQPGPSPRKTH